MSNASTFFTPDFLLQSPEFCEKSKGFWRDSRGAEDVPVAIMVSGTERRDAKSGSGFSRDSRKFHGNARAMVFRQNRSRGWDAKTL
jgi:hypothetical protein